MAQRSPNQVDLLLALPLIAVLLSLWFIAIQLYLRVPHVYDAYATIYAGSPRHQRENTFIFLTVFPFMATLVAGAFVSSVRKGWSDIGSKGAGPLVGSAMIMLFFIVASFERFHAVRAFYGF